MTHEQTEAFFARLDADPEFAERLAALSDSPEAVFALVQSEGFDVDPTEIREVFLERHGSELDEDQLAVIAGGLSNDQIGNIVIGTGIAAVGIGVGAASAAAAA